MENQTQPKSEATPATHNPESNWIADRKAAHLAAFQEVRGMGNYELIALLQNAAEDAAERAGDLTDHDDAFPDLMREACCLYAADILRRCAIREGAFNAWRKEANKGDAR